MVLSQDDHRLIMKGEAVMFYGEFSCCEDVCREFGINDFDGHIVHAAYDVYGYEGSALVIFIRAGKFYLVQDSHCSCNGLTFEPEETSAKEIAHLIREGNMTGLKGNTKLAKAIEILDDLIEEDSSEDAIHAALLLLL
jgi:hypothetical protein